MSVVLYWFHLKGSGVVTPPTPPRPQGLGGNALAKRKKPHSEFIREAVEALLAMEPGTPQYRARLAQARRLVITKHAQKTKQLTEADDEMMVILFLLDLL